MILSICCITYNHEKFLQQTIEGFLAQQTNFDIEIIISDDCSSDGTRKICEEYKNRYPDKIRLALNTINFGMIQNFIQALNMCSGKYIAMCEGDDYWIDPYKLQKQVDFLEANPEYAICFTGYKIINEFVNQETIHIPEPQSISIEEMIKQNIYSTATTVFLSEYMNPIPEWFSKMVFGDWSLYINVLYTSKKKAYCLNDITAVYRIHPGGVHGNLHASTKKLIKAYKQHIDFYRTIQVNLLKENYLGIVGQCIRERKKIISYLLYKEKDFVGVMLNKFY